MSIDTATIPPHADAGYFDLQLNGYGGVDFNSDDLTASGLHQACVCLERDGIAGSLATIITDDVKSMCARLSNLVRLRENDVLARQRIVGLHIEGPFLSEKDGYRGAHPLDAVRPADISVMQRLLDASQGLTRLVTLAPERDPDLRVTTMLAKQGIIVSCGHTDASLDQLDAAADAGATLFTHLGNGCPPRGMDRHDNIIQRGLSLCERLLPTFIADGAHIPFFALRNYLRTVGPERCILVSDAIAPAGLGPGRYRVFRWDLVIGEDLVARSHDGSHLVGSAVSLAEAARRALRHLGLTEQQVEQMACVNPRRAIGL